MLLCVLTSPLFTHLAIAGSNDADRIDYAMVQLEICPFLNGSPLSTSSDDNFYIEIANIENLENVCAVYSSISSLPKVISLTVERTRVKSSEGLYYNKEAEYEL